jgi:hypothetical protein
MHQFETLPRAPPRYCITLPNGRRCCCEHGWPLVWRRMVRTRHGLRPRSYTTCP